MALLSPAGPVPPEGLCASGRAAHPARPPTPSEGPLVVRSSIMKCPTSGTFDRRHFPTCDSVPTVTQDRTRRSRQTSRGRGGFGNARCGRRVQCGQCCPFSKERGEAVRTSQRAGLARRRRRRRPRRPAAPRLCLGRRLAAPRPLRPPSRGREAASSVSRRAVLGRPPRCRSSHHALVSCQPPFSFHSKRQAPRTI